MTNSFCECGSDKTKCDRHFANAKKEYEETMKKISQGAAPGPHHLKECPSGFKVRADIGNTVFLDDKEKNFMENSYMMGFGMTLPKGLTQEDLYQMIPIQKFEPNPDMNKKSLLSKQQWNAILYPGCYAKNWEYYQDAQNAYRTSKEHGGTGCIDNSWAKNGNQ
jgi:hypothetical protein